MLGAARPHFLAVDDVAVALLYGGGADRGGVRAGRGLGDAEGLEAQASRRDLRQESFLLCRAAVPEDRAHDVHLGVASGAVAAAGMHLLEDRRRGGDAEPTAAEFFGDE